MEDTKISWCDHTFNHVRGCVEVSPGCQNCYARELAKVNPGTLGVWGTEANGGKRVVAAESYWKQLFTWNKQAEKQKKLKTIFCASLADVFEDWNGPILNHYGQTGYLDKKGQWFFTAAQNVGAEFARMTLHDVRKRLFRVIEKTPYLIYLLLTKRPENILDMMRVVTNDSEKNTVYFPPNVMIGTTIENQSMAERRLPYLQVLPKSLRIFLSCEPLLEDISLVNDDEGSLRGLIIQESGGRMPSTSDGPGEAFDDSYPFVDWIICGGESQTNPNKDSRPFDLGWARNLRDQCLLTEIPFHMKQMGSEPEEWVPSGEWKGDGMKMSLNLQDPKGGDVDEWPQDLRIRQFPDWMDLFENPLQRNEGLFQNIDWARAAMEYEQKD